MEYSGKFQLSSSATIYATTNTTTNNAFSANDSTNVTPTPATDDVSTTHNGIFTPETLWLPQMPPNFTQARTNMPLQPSTCHNQMPLCSYHDPYHNMPSSRHPHQMQQTQTPMMNYGRPSDYVFYQQMEKNNMYQRNIYHQISQPMYTHQMNWRLK